MGGFASWLDGELELASPYSRPTCNEQEHADVPEAHDFCYPRTLACGVYVRTRKPTSERLNLRSRRSYPNGPGGPSRARTLSPLILRHDVRQNMEGHWSPMPQGRQKTSLFSTLCDPWCSRGRLHLHIGYPHFKSPLT